MSYSCYIVEPNEIQKIRSFSKTNIVCHQVTIERSDRDECVLPESAKLCAVGIIEDELAQVLIISVNNQIKRPDGRIYHLLMSAMPGVSSSYAEEIIDREGWFCLPKPVPISSRPYAIRWKTNFHKEQKYYVA